jgi:transposase-like protein
MQLTAVKCPVCGGTKVSKNGKTENGVQRYICNNKECYGKSFMLEHKYNGWKPGIEAQIIEMTSNASGIRDISRVLKISKQKVSDTLKKLKTQQVK